MHVADPTPITPDVLAKLHACQGRVETLHDEVTRAPLRALAATLDLEVIDPSLGDAIPALWHWLYFLPRVRQSQIGGDGHPKLGGFLPPVPLPRRMWAGEPSELAFPYARGGSPATHLQHRLRRTQGGTNG
jgi:3-methylfumaryl-CoA hydratase